LREIRLQYWKLQYHKSPAGSIYSADGRCFEGQSTSSTRIFRVSTLRRLYATLANEMSNVSFAEWLVALDLEAARLSIRIHTCVAEPLLDQNYLDHARLTPFLANRFQVEVARFSHRQWVQCLPIEVNLGLVAHSGLVRSWCTRKATMDNWEMAESSWLKGDDRRFLCLAHGGFLSLLRGGTLGIMPWDNDVDAHRCSTQLSTAAHHAERTPFGVMHIYPSEMPFRFQLFGRLEVRFSQFWMEHHLWAQKGRYGAFAVKMTWAGPEEHRAFRPLRCNLHHTACLPSCRSPTRCEFEDHFVHVDHWY